MRLCAVFALGLWASACIHAPCRGVGGVEVRDWDGLKVRKVAFSRAENERLEGQCQLCEEGKYQALSSATGRKACLECPSHASSPLGAASLLDCVCVPGYTGVQGGPCNACTSGKFKSTGGTGPCALCDPGSFSQAGASVCTACSPGSYEPESGSTGCSGTCPAFTNSRAGSTNIANCSCSEGYTGDHPDNPCQPCAPGTHKSTQGSAACQDCPAGTYSADAASSCTQCPVSKYSAATAQACESCPQDTVSPAGSTSADSCQCKAGYFLFNVLCFACPPGTYSAEPGRSSCEFCGPGKYTGSTGSTACALCAEASYSIGPANSECLSCPAGKVGSIRGGESLSTACPVDCAPGTYSEAGATACTACTIGTFSSLNRDNCTACPPGFSSFSGSWSPEDCVQGVVCAIGQSANAQGVCTPCAPGWTTPPRSYPQSCSVPCSPDMHAASLQTGCRGAWFRSIARADGCSQGSCSDICGSHGRTCAADSLSRVDTRQRMTELARLVDVNCTAEGCSSSDSQCAEDLEQGITESEQDIVSGPGGNLNPVSLYESYFDHGPCYFSGAGDCDASACEAHRICPCV